MKLKLLFVFAVVVVGLGWSASPQAQAQDVGLYFALNVENVDNGTVPQMRITIEMSQELSATSLNERLMYATKYNAGPLFTSVDIACENGICSGSQVLMTDSITWIDFDSSKRSRFVYALRLGGAATEAGYHGSAKGRSITDSGLLSGISQVFLGGQITDLPRGVVSNPFELSIEVPTESTSFVLTSTDARCTYSTKQQNAVPQDVGTSIITLLAEAACEGTEGDRKELELALYVEGRLGPMAQETLQFRIPWRVWLAVLNNG